MHALECEAVCAKRHVSDRKSAQVYHPRTFDFAAFDARFQRALRDAEQSAAAGKPPLTHAGSPQPRNLQQRKVRYALAPRIIWGRLGTISVTYFPNYSTKACSHIVLCKGLLI